MLKTLPLSPNGKVDRSRLPDPGEVFPPPANVAAPPRSALESVLASAWAAILGLPAVGIQDNFLDLGGHSLSAMRLVHALNDAGVGELSLREIFDHPTVAAQARLLEARIRAEQAQPEVNEGIPSIVDIDSRDVSATFDCPQEPSPHFGRRPCNLVMVLCGDDDLDSFVRVARFVSEVDPTVKTFVVKDAPDWEAGLPPCPTLVFSPALLRHRPVTPVCVCCGYPLAKSEEYRILELANISVPRWVTLEAWQTPDLSGFGKYVVRKPDYGAKGAEVRIVRRDRMRWKPVVTSAAGPSPRLLVQEFVYTGLWPISYRVNTLFGRVLYCLTITGNQARSTLTGPDDFGARGIGGQMVSIVSNARDSHAELCMDAEIINFGERAARAFPDMPMLGVDILKDARTGKLVVTEVNSLGHNWNFNPDFRAAFGVDVAQQFDGLRKAAYILAEETQRRASLPSLRFPG
jgi:aryl carrier-like protein